MARPRTPRTPLAPPAGALVLLLSLAGVPGGLGAAAALPGPGVPPRAPTGTPRGPVQDGPDRAQQVEKFERYLASRPYHERAFDSLMEAATATNSVGDLVAAHEAALADGSATQADRVVLARLYARTDRAREALELLRALEDDGPERWKLIGVLELDRGEPEAGLAALDRAAAGTDDPRELEDVHARRGRAFLQLGRREEAAAAFRAVAELRPEDFDTRLTAATELAHNALFDEALAEFEVAEGLAAGDAQRRCRVLREIGRMHERLDRADEALAVYDRALGLLARGHWLRVELEGRVLGLHKRVGTLDALIEDLARAAAERPEDLSARELHARALVEAGRHGDARAVLEGAVAAFPGDLDLSRRLRDVLRTLDDPDARIAEYQRILTERPDELELYLELGEAFASEGRFDAARRQWNRSLEQRLTDPGLCVRLAGFYALYDLVDDAVSMYRRAIELEPDEVRHASDLCALLAVRERADEIPAVIEEAEVRAEGLALRLEEVAGLWAEHGRPDRGRACLERALELVPADARLESRLADLLVREGDVARAGQVLRQVVEHADERTLRSSAVDRLVRLHREQGDPAELARQVEAELAGEAPGRAPYLVLARMHVLRRAPDDAIALYRALLEPANLERLGLEADARTALAHLYEEAGEYPRALAEYEALIAADPRTRRRHLREVARIHLALYDQDAAFACYEEILRGAPDNPAAFQEVADAYRSLGLHERVIECLAQAVRLRPEDARLRLELADAYRVLGRWEQARDHTVAAFDARERELRERARKTYYLLLAEGGRLEEEVERLERRTAENPYDLEAPLSLVDIHVRELEFEKALALVDDLLSLQPDSRPLRLQRADLLARLERHGDAIAAYEDLWRDQDANHDQLALDIATAALEMGDLARAEKVLAGVQDARKVARLQREHGLPEAAVETLQRAARATPNNTRLLASLARAQEDLGDREGAAETYRAMLDRRGDTWPLLVHLGELLHTTGRKEESLEIGRRLFALVREEVEDADLYEEEADERDPWTPLRTTRRSSYAGRQQYVRRLGELKQYFETKGWIAEYLELAVDELRRQPANADFLNQCWWVFDQVEDSRPTAVALLREMRAGVRDGGRVPPDFTREGWLESLRSREVGLYSSDAVLARARLAELEARLAAGEADADECLEHVQLLSVLARDEERLPALAAALERFPDDPNLRAGHAQLLQAETRLEEAVEAWRAALPVLDTPAYHAREARERALYERRDRDGLMNRFPVHLQAKVTDAHLDDLRQLQDSGGLYLRWGVGSRPDPDGARLMLARALFQLERDDEAAAVLRELEPEDDRHLGRMGTLAHLYWDEDRFDDALRLHERMRAVEERYEDDPLLGLVRPWAGRMTTALVDQARILEDRGEVLEAYELFSSRGRRNEGELLLTTHDAFDAAEARYRGRFEAVAPEDVAGLPYEAQRDWRNAGVQLTDVLGFGKRWDEVTAVHERLCAGLPDAFDLHRNLALLYVRAERVDDAIEVHRRVLARKQELNRAMLRDDRPAGLVLAPRTPPGVDTGDWLIQQLSSRSYGASTAIHNVREEYARILQLYLEDGRHAEAADVLRRMAREDVASFRHLGGTVRSLVDRYQLGARAVPILRLLHSYAPEDQNMALEYARALVQAGELEAAHPILETALRKLRGRGWYDERRIEEELERLEARLGLDRRTSLAQLAEEVDADPANVRLRTKLARRLFREREYEASLEQALEAERRAPHRDEVRELVHDCLALLGRREELERRTAERLPRTGDAAERFGMRATLANWHMARGETDEAVALMRDALEVRSGGYIEHPPSSWFLSHGLWDEAERALEAEIAATGGGQWSADQPRQRLEALYLRQGDPTRALDKAWERFEKATGRGARLMFFRQLPGVLRRLEDPTAARDLMLTRAEELGGLRGGLYRAAYELAVADLDAAEATLDRLVREEPEADFLWPARIDLARARQDLPGVLELLERMEASLDLSESRTTYTVLGSLSERDALTAERAAVLYQLGREDEAWDLWRSMFDATEEERARPVLTQLCELLERHDEAARLQRETLEEQGEQNWNLLQRLADLEVELGNHEQAAGLLERALILSGRNAGVRDRLIAVHRRTGTVEAYLDELAEEAAADPEDEAVQRALLRLAMELDRTDLARTAAERLARRSSQRATMNAFLGELAILEGDLERALALRREVLEDEGVPASTRKQLADTVAARRVRDGDPEGAVRLLREVRHDEDPLEVDRRALRLWQGAERWEDVVRLADAILEQVPDDGDALDARLAALAELGRAREAFDQLLAVLADPDLETRHASFVYRLTPLGPEALEAEVERLAAARAADPEGFAHADALGLLAARVGRRALAVEALRAHVERVPDAHAALVQLTAELRDAGELDELRAVLLARIDLLDRRSADAESPWSTANQVNALRHQLAVVEFLRGDRERALLEWRTPRGRTYEEPAADLYGYYQNPFERDTGWSYLSHLQGHGLHDEFVRAQRAYSSFDPWSNQWNWLPLVEARYRAHPEQHAAVREGLWERVTDRAKGMVLDPDTYYFWYDPWGAGAAKPEWVTLVRMFREDGLEDELRARIAAGLAADPSSDVFLGLTRYLQVLDEDWEPLLDEAREAVEESPDDAELIRRYAERLAEAGHHAEAAERYEQLLRLQMAEVQRIYYRRVTYGPGTDRKTHAAGTIRFGWSDGGGSLVGGFVSYSSYVSSGSSGTPESGTRRELIALHRRLGDDARADELERVERLAVDLEGRELPTLLADLARDCAEVGAWDAAWRLAEESEAELEADERPTWAWARLVPLAEEAGERERAREAAARALPRFDRTIERDPWNARGWSGRAAWRLDHLDDPAGAVADLERCLELAPLDAEACLQLARARRALGDAEGAYETLTEAERVSLALGRDLGSGLPYVRGLLKADLGLEGATADLRRALAEDPDHPCAAEARTVLQ